MHAPLNVAELVDELGRVKALIADLTGLEKTIKTQLDVLSPGAYEGETFRLTVSESQRETLDMDAVREKLSRQFILAHTRITDVRSYRVVARTRK